MNEDDIKIIGKIIDSDMGDSVSRFVRQAIREKLRGQETKILELI